MNEIVIGSANVSIKEYKGQRVVTFKDIDTVHGRPNGTARRNFNRNKEHFIEGEDFFVRNSYEAKKEYNATAPNGLILITESGYLMLAKSFTDSKAWDVQRALVKSYFVKKSVTYPVPNSMAELMRCYDKLPEKQKNAVLVKIKEAEKLSKTNEPCECTAKFYFDGKTDVPCVTIDDIADLTGIPRSTIHHEMHRRCRAGIDYLLLEGEELVEFKKKNPSVNERCHLKLNIIFKPGFDILMKFFNKVLSQPEHFKTIEDKAFKVDNKPSATPFEQINEVLKHNMYKCDVGQIDFLMGLVEEHYNYLHPATAVDEIRRIMRKRKNEFSREDIIKLGAYFEEWLNSMSKEDVSDTIDEKMIWKMGEIKRYSMALNSVIDGAKVILESTMKLPLNKSI